MKKAFVIVIASISFLIVSNIYYYQDTYSWQLDTQKTILEKQLRSCKLDIVQFFNEIETNVLLLLSEKELSGLFSFQLESQDVQKRIELLYNRYENGLYKLAVYDTKGNFYSIDKSTNNNTIARYGKVSRKEQFKRTVKFSSDYNSIIVNQPLYSDTHIFGYVVFYMNTKLFFNQIFNGFNLEEQQFQWIATKDGKLLFATVPRLRISGIESSKKTNDNLSKELYLLSLDHNYIQALSVYEDLKLSDIDLTMAFSMPVEPISRSIFKNSMIVAFISFVVILMIVVVLYHSILKNKTSQQRLAQSEDALRKILYYAPVGIVLENTDNKIQLVNKAALHLFDCEDEGMLLQQECSEKTLFEKKRSIESSSISKSSKKYVFNGGYKNKQVILSERIPFFNQNAKYYINSFIEITPLENKRHKKEKHHKAQTTFIANISHELRTPLNAIIGMTDILLSSLAASAEKEMLRVVKRSADTLLALINDILDFSKIEAGKLEVESIPVNIEKEIEQCIDDFKISCKERSIALSWAHDVELPANFVTDPLRFKQVLNNLIGNAIKFTPAGSVHLHITKASTINGRPALQFTISDTGIGIRKEKLKTIFNSFAQEDNSTTRKYGGTGLGTSISKTLVCLMGGEIWADSPSSISTDPKYPGADFSFTLPASTSPQLKDLDYSYIMSWNQINALIITDDNLQVQNIIKNFMALGINYKIMAPSQETVQMVKEHGNIQIIVIDHRPDFNGLDFLQQCYNHTIHNEHIIIFQSSDYESTNTNLCRKLGADAYLRKPVKLDTLRSFMLKYFSSIIGQYDLIGQVVPDNLKILVAEDNLFNQRVAQNLFRKIGYSIDLANNGREAVNKFKEKKYDIIFMDLMMPELDGFDAARELKCYDETCPVIAMTANNDKSQKELAFKAGMDDFIIKPAQKEEISRMIIKWCSS
jgi:signal transduction histidine kinase/DNA-binding response OmpR family regulator